MSKYDYFIAGRWRNHVAIREVLNAVRKSGKTAYCFIENAYEGDGVKFETGPDVDAEAMMATTESLVDWQTNPTFQKIFENDMNALKDSDCLILVLPAGLAAHMELGAAYGMGKKCYAIGAPEKPETLYLMLDGMYSTVENFLKVKSGVVA
jgi:hypothetical protein